MYATNITIIIQVNGLPSCPFNSLCLLHLILSSSVPLPLKWYWPLRHCCRCCRRHSLARSLARRSSHSHTNKSRSQIAKYNTVFVLQLNKILYVLHLCALFSMAVCIHIHLTFVHARWMCTDCSLFTLYRTEVNDFRLSYLNKCVLWMCSLCF